MSREGLLSPCSNEECDGAITADNWPDGGHDGMGYPLCPECFASYQEMVAARRNWRAMMRGEGDE